MRLLSGLLLLAAGLSPAADPPKESPSPVKPFFDPNAPAPTVDPTIPVPEPALPETTRTEKKKPLVPERKKPKPKN